MTESNSTVAPPAAAGQRREQMFPTLALDELARIARFGQPRAFAKGEALFLTGDHGIGLMVLLSGRVAITQIDGAGHRSPVAEHGPGALIGEISGLTGKPALVDGVATEPGELYILGPADLRALIVAEAELGERIMRAQILRRTSLIENAAGGPIILAPGNDPGRVRVAGFLRRNAFPFRVLDPGIDGEGAELSAPLQPAVDDLPLVILADGRILRNPSDSELAVALGMVGRADDAPGGGVSRRSRRQGVDAGPRRRPCRDHVALSDRPHLGQSTHRAFAAHGNQCAAR